MPYHRSIEIVSTIERAGAIKARVKLISMEAGRYYGKEGCREEERTEAKSPAGLTDLVLVATVISVDNGRGCVPSGLVHRTLEPALLDPRQVAQYVQGVLEVFLRVNDYLRPEALMCLSLG